MQTNWKNRLLRTAVLGGAIGLGMAAMAAISAPASPEAADPAAMMEQHHAQMQKHFDKVMTEIGASDEQKQQIGALIKDAMTAEHADIQQFHQNLGQLKTLLAANDIDEAAVAKLRGQQDQLLLAADQRVTDTLVASAKLLTAAQRQMLVAHIDKMEASGHHHMMSFHGG
jgi:Spy/CpxP family protein refolding chaperone